MNPQDFSDWSFDGSSTGQAEGNNSDCILRRAQRPLPVVCCKPPKEFCCGVQHQQPGQGVYFIWQVEARACQIKVHRRKWLTSSRIMSVLRSTGVLGRRVLQCNYVMKLQRGVLVLLQACHLRTKGCSPPAQPR